MKFKIGDKVWWHNSLGHIFMDDYGTILSLELYERYNVKWHNTKLKDPDEIRTELEEELMLVPLDGNIILKDML